MASGGESIPSPHLLVRSEKGWQIWEQSIAASDSGKQEGLFKPITENKPCADMEIQFNQDGSLICVCTEEGIGIYDCQKNYELILTLNQRKVRHVIFSPQSNFILAYHHRTVEDKKGNCWVWLWRESKCVHQFPCDEFDPTKPPLVFSNDDNICSRIAAEGLLMFNSHQLLCNVSQKESGRIPSYRLSVFAKLDVQKIAKVKYAPVLSQTKKGKNKKVDSNEEKQNIPSMANEYLLAVFNLPNPKKSIPASVCIYEFNAVSNKFFKLLARSMFEADNCHLLWNKSGNSLLAYVSTDVDTSGKSYYGKEQLYLMNPKRNVNAMISLSEKGGLQEAQWHPNSEEFVVIDDHPPRITCYDQKGTVVQEIANGCPRNVIRFDSHGQLMWMGGFGNLNGEMSFMHWKGSKGVEMLGFNKDETCRYYEYSPDSSLFVTARLHEFIKIDNGFRIYTYNGHLLTDFKYEKLHQIAFRPMPLHTYPERKNIRKGPTQPKESDKKTYVPPHLREKGENPKTQNKQHKRPDHNNEMKQSSNETTSAQTQQKKGPQNPKKQNQNKQETDNTFWPRGIKFQEHMEKPLDETENKVAKKRKKRKQKEKGPEGQTDTTAKTDNEKTE